MNVYPLCKASIKRMSWSGLLSLLPSSWINIKPFWASSSQARLTSSYARSTSANPVSSASTAASVKLAASLSRRITKAKQYTVRHSLCKNSHTESKYFEIIGLTIGFLSYVIIVLWIIFYVRNKVEEIPVFKSTENDTVVKSDFYQFQFCTFSFAIAYLLANCKYLQGWCWVMGINQCATTHGVNDVCKSVLQLHQSSHCTNPSKPQKETETHWPQVWPFSVWK